MLPIGTIIYNSKNQNLQMIISYYPIEKKTGEKFEYLTCLYPLGYGSELPQYFVNSKDFKYIVHEGLKLDYFDDFANEVTKIISNKSEKEKISDIDMSQFTEL